MAWPDTPLTTYVASSTPAIKASDLNDFQSAINLLWGATAGTSFYVFEDDFDGSDYADGQTAGYTVLGKFALTDPGASGSYSEPSSTDGAMGVLNVVNADGAGTLTNPITGTAALLSCGTRDFYYRARLRVTDKSGLTSGTGLNFGMLTTAFNPIYPGFNLRSGDTNWYRYDTDGTTRVDTGIAHASGYHKFEAIRIAGVTTFLIDGASAGSESADTTSVNLRPGFGLNAVSKSIGFEYAAFDYFKFACPRP